MRHLPKILALCLFALLVSHTARAQDETEPGADPDEDSVTESVTESGVDQAVPAEPGDDSDVADATDTDPGSYLDIEDDDFKPSEEVPADQSIDFPTDI